MKKIKVSKAKSGRTDPPAGEKKTLTPRPLYDEWRKSALKGNNDIKEEKTLTPQNQYQEYRKSVQRGYKPPKATPTTDTSSEKKQPRPNPRYHKSGGTIKKAPDGYTIKKVSGPHKTITKGEKSGKDLGGEKGKPPFPKGRKGMPYVKPTMGGAKSGGKMGKCKGGC